MSVNTLIEIPITGTSTGAATVNAAVFDFAAANIGGTNLDNSVVSLRANLLIATNTFNAGFMQRLDTVIKRISGTITLISQTSSFGPGPTNVFAGDAGVLSFLSSVQYIVSGTQIILQVITSGGAGTFVYGGRMIGISDK